MGKHLVALAAVVVAAASAGAQTTRPATPAPPHMRIDPAAGVVELDAEVVLTRGPLELLLCATGSKEHESILACPARPSHVHAALLALGLRCGRGGHWMESPDGQAVYRPPAGAALDIRLRYADPDGAEHTVPAGRWIRSLKTKAPVDELHWVFIGSAPPADGVYAADRTGETISVANFPHAVLDVPLASSTDAADLAFEAHAEAIPPRGTKVTVILAPRPKADRAPVARAVFDIDRFGACRLDGAPVAADRIAAWAEAFRRRHARPYILIRPAARTMIFHVERLKAILADADIADIEVRPRPPRGQILPRTPAQADAGVRGLAAALAGREDSPTDPAEQARRLLNQIDHQRAELETLSALWADYRRRIADTVEPHDAAAAKESTP